MNSRMGRRHFLAASSTLALGAISSPAFAQQKLLGAKSAWWCWRGPNGDGTCDQTVSHSLQKDKMKWATPVPGRGHASATVTDGGIYLPTADKAQQTQSVLAFNRADGKPLWSQVIHRGGLNHKNHPKNTEATPTIAFDGERLFAVFFNADAIHLTALNPQGETLYQKTLGTYKPEKYPYGYAPSPIIYQNFVLVAAEYELEAYIVALDRATGNEIWRIKRPNNYSFSPPIVARTSGRDQLVISGANQVASYDPMPGQQLWTTAATTAATCGSIVWDEERVYASGGYPKPETVCIASDGTGRVIWKNDQKCYEQSMLYHEGAVYCVNDTGIAYCWRASDGEVMWRERFGGPYSSSPTLAKDVIHVFSEAGEHFAYRPNPERFELLAREQVATDVFASPSIVENTMYLRVGNTGPDGVRQEYLAALT